MQPRKPAKSSEEYLLKVYRCPYCDESFNEYEINKHVEVCYMFHRKKVREKYAKRAKKVWKERQ